MLAEIQWKVLADFPRALWQTNGIRIASPAEQAAFNFIANLPEDVILPDRLREKTSKDIGESTVFLESHAENQLTMRDIWTRLLRELDCLEGSDQVILELDGRKFTAIISSGLPNACAVFKFINEYSNSEAGSTGFIRHIELADCTTLKLASLARIACTWHFLYEDLVLIALDPENQGRSAYLGTNQPSKGDPDLQHYLGRPKYKPVEHIELVECSCTDDVRRRFLREKLTTSLDGASGLRAFGCLSSSTSGAAAEHLTCHGIPIARMTRTISDCCAISIS